MPLVPDRCLKVTLLQFSVFAPLLRAAAYGDILRDSYWSNAIMLSWILLVKGLPYPPPFHCCDFSWGNEVGGWFTCMIS